jgi:hypothetical protein
MGGSKSDKIARSPTPPETDDDEEDSEWPVHGIVGEDVDVFGISRYGQQTVLKSSHNPTPSPTFSFGPVTRQAPFFHLKKPHSMAFVFDTLPPLLPKGPLERLEAPGRHEHDVDARDRRRPGAGRQLERRDEAPAAEKGGRVAVDRPDAAGVDADARPADIRARAGGRGEDGRERAEGRWVAGKGVSGLDGGDRQAGRTPRAWTCWC